MGEFPTSTATDTDLIALGGQLEGLLREYMDAWLEWAPRMRAAHAEAKDNMSALAVAIQRTGCQERMSELEHDMQPLAEEIIAAPVTSLGGLRAKALVALWEAMRADGPCSRQAMWAGGPQPPASPPAARAPRAATPPQRRRAWLRNFVVRCSLPCDPPVGGHSCNRGMLPRFHRAVSD
jgi:hypothetical protein